MKVNQSKPSFFGTEYTVQAEEIKRGLVKDAISSGTGVRLVPVPSSGGRRLAPIAARPVGIRAAGLEMKNKENILNPKADFRKTIERLVGRHQLWQVFSDFCEMSAISLSNVVLQDEEREKRYLQIIGQYTKEESAQFPKLLACVVDALEFEYCDFLGHQFMDLDLGSHWKGQFFSPYRLCRVMANATIGDAEEAVKAKGFITINDPACGAGAMLIASAETLKDKGINYQEHMHATATDVDQTAAFMCYIQLSLLHVPATVIIGNTLSMEVRSVWHTMAHHLGFWEGKLRRGYAIGYEAGLKTVPAQIVQSEAVAQFDDKGQGMLVL